MTAWLVVVLLLLVVPILMLTAREVLPLMASSSTLPLAFSSCAALAAYRACSLLSLTSLPRLIGAVTLVMASMVAPPSDTVSPVCLNSWLSLFWNLLSVSVMLTV